MSLGLIVVLLLILGSEFVNGWTDSPNAIATVVSTRVIKPRWAVLMATVFNILGTFIGVKVAKTIGKGFINPEVISQHGGEGLLVAGAAMVGIIIWSTTAWYFGLPTSESHALMAGLTGAGLAVFGPSALVAAGWIQVIIGLILASLVGFVGGYAIAWAIRFFCKRWPRAKATRFFNVLQCFSAAGMALSHGSNDGQKFIGTFTFALFAAGLLPAMEVQTWTILLCSLVMGIGTSIGGWRIIKTMGQKMAKLESYQGFAAEASASGAILLASATGVPLSTTQTINTSIMGVGAATRLSAINWGVAKEMVTAWILTFPIAFAIGFCVAKAFTWIF